MWLIMLIVVPIVVLLLLGLALSAILAIAFSLIAYALPVLLILASVWLVAKAFGGPRGRHHGRRGGHADRHRPYRPSAPHAPPRPAQHGPVQYEPAPTARREIPIDVQVKAEQIRHKVNVLLGYADRFAPFSRDLYIVRQTAAEYLPRTLDAYLAIPGTDDPLVRSTGRTALEELRAQLALLDSRLDAITQNLQQRDLDGLAANRRFLEERFGALDDEDEEIAAVPRFLSATDGGRRTQSA
jgi:hypothetical protein